MHSLSERARTIATEVAAPHADAVDRDARFPAEAFAALKELRLLGILVPRAFGGEGAGIKEVAEICHLLGQSCAATAMIYAMHQIQAACVVTHGQGSSWHRQLMMRLASEQLLLASATSEAGIGGDVRTSACAIEAAGDRFKLEKNATVISYGAHADGILVTARRTPDAPPSDQVIAAVLAGDYQLEPTTGWDTLGMRGTCSNGYRLHAVGGIEQILPLSYADISARTMLPVSHLTWSSLWLGIATEAVTRAQSFVRAAARKKPAVMPPGALRLAEAVSMLQLTKANVVAALDRYEAALGLADELGALSFAVMMNNLKTGTSQMAIEVINAALLTCGIAGYKNDTPYSVGRHLRDAYSALLMVNNDRIFTNTANLLLVHKHDIKLLG